MPDKFFYCKVEGDTFYWPGAKAMPLQRSYTDSICFGKALADKQTKALLQTRLKAGANSWFLLFIVLIVILQVYLSPSEKDPNAFDEGNDLPFDDTVYYTNVLILNGGELQFEYTEIHAVLIKRQPFYNKLDGEGQKKFIKRLKSFMACKNFVIHDASGFKEMPILVSAAAIQLTFGLNKYHLPAYNQIHIHPEEYFGAADLRVLAGNVEGRRIALSWKHFLEGFHYPENGENVGLHEMAHALYGQVFWFDKLGHKHFRKTWGSFQAHAAMVYETEKTMEQGLYSDYAVKNMHEFWAESIELFFEKPAALQTQYPQLHQSLCHLLRQNHPMPVTGMA